MCVECADADDNIGGEAESFRPLGGKMACGLVGGVGVGEEAGAETFEERIEGGEKFFGGEAAVFPGPEGFVAGGADAAAHLADVVTAGEEEGYPIRMFDPGMTGLSNVVVHAKYME
jgi:hypothetical protein